MADETGLVPEEAIKAAAEGIRERDLTAPRPGPLAALAYGRAALEAAAPLILAAYLRCEPTLLLVSEKTETDP